MARRKKPVPTYSVHPTDVHDRPAWELVRTRGRTSATNSSVITEYTDRTAADIVAAAMNAAAPHED
ncbi:hypothetical protein QFZ75_008027 [Streptomyces sp. V3I8]|uniref:hypothetical protein n=1 Tax=Streptomyces sp. V3I8 TaxID=3042279 RepID=UPI00278057A2|nr:hypothetical protein [Streptomyces sp. V3I8]MDQ1041525.1 hypothetical protein [Streptomyces sp. V3I8]